MYLPSSIKHSAVNGAKRRDIKSYLTFFTKWAIHNRDKLLPLIRYFQFAFPLLNSLFSFFGFTSEKGLYALFSNSFRKGAPHRPK